jgi:hypothetical protein
MLVLVSFLDSDVLAARCALVTGVVILSYILDVYYSGYHS